MSAPSVPYPCPSCGGGAERPFYAVDAVPVHQVKLVRTRAAALSCATGDIRMCFCPSCGFVWNARSMRRACAIRTTTNRPRRCRRPSTPSTSAWRAT